MEERPKRHSFGKGLLCGILLCVVAMGVGGCEGKVPLQLSGAS